MQSPSLSPIIEHSLATLPLRYAETRQVELIHVCLWLFLLLTVMCIRPSRECTPLSCRTASFLMHSAKKMPTTLSRTCFIRLLSILPYAATPLQGASSSTAPRVTPCASIFTTASFQHRYPGPSLFNSSGIPSSPAVLTASWPTPTFNFRTQCSSFMRGRRASVA